MIVDHATIFVRSGRGGDGCVSFRRLKYIPKGGPDGGDGGDGGSVILVADPQVETLLDFAGRHHWRADGGQPGTGKQRHGKNADDLEVHLPVGTLIYNDETGDLMVDLAEPGQRVTVAKGGRGGFGNEHFASPTHQVPTEFTPGEPVESFTLRLELKLIADVGLVGKPNAGKSTLLSRISAARPKIADYPFTTLTPQLGIAELPGHRRLVVADIPGLIENAHTGAGLGVQFLRHIERTGVLIHLIEIEPADGSDPIENYHAIERELTAYSPLLAGKTRLLAVSKVDLYPAEQDQQTAISLIEDALGQTVYPVSSSSGQGIVPLLQACWLALGKSPADDGWPRQAPVKESPDHA